MYIFFLLCIFEFLYSTTLIRKFEMQQKKNILTSCYEIFLLKTRRYHFSLIKKKKMKKKQNATTPTTRTTAKFFNNLI